MTRSSFAKSSRRGYVALQSHSGHVEFRTDQNLEK
jgi:hypothetical protein